MLQYVPSFTCKYCGESKDSFVQGEVGVFIPCQCEESRKQRDQDHYREMERRKQLRRKNQ